MLHILTVLFGWPYGIVVGNLIASALWATPAFIHVHKKLDRHRRHLVEQDKVLAQLGSGREEEPGLPS